MVPEWRRIVAAVGDALVIALAAAWLHSEFTGGGRWDLGPLTLSNRSSARVFIQLLAAWSLRRLLVPRPSLIDRVREIVTRVTGARPRAHREPPPFSATWLDRARPVVVAAVALVLTRAAVLGVGYVATVSTPLTGDPVRDESFVRSKSAPREYLHGRWDAGWYASIATLGYHQNGNTRAVAFFPAFPLAIKAVMQVTDPLTVAIGRPKLFGRERGVRAEAAGALFSVLMFGAALLLLGRMATLDLGPGFASRAIVIAAVAPYSIFFSAPYTESLFLVGVVGAFLCQRLNRFGWCALFAFLAGLTRQTGFLLAVPLAVYAATQWRANAERPRWRAGMLICVIAPVAGMLTYSGYLWWRFGDPLAWVWAQSAWGKSERWLHLAQADSLRVFIARYPYEAINLLAVAVAMPIIWASRKLQASYLVFGVLTVVVPVFVGVLTLGRMTAPVFPIYLVLAARVRRPLHFSILVIALFLLQLAAASQFYSWRPVN